MKNCLFPVVILAGGLATRLRPLTEKIPKILISIHGEPFLNHQLRLLHQQGIQDVVLCVGYLGEFVEKHLTNLPSDMKVRVVYDGGKLLGTAGAIKKALPLLGDAFFVLYGDSYLTCQYSDVQKAFMHQKKQALMTVFKNEGLWDKSNIEFTNDEIIAYDKAAPHAGMHYIDYGLGIFSRQAFELVPSDTPYDLSLLYQSLLRQHELGAYEVDKRFYEIGSFAGIKELEYHLSQLEMMKYPRHTE